MLDLQHNRSRLTRGSRTWMRAAHLRLRFQRHACRGSLWPAIRLRRRGVDCSRDTVPEPNLIVVGAGRLALSHRPKRTGIARLRDMGVTQVVTLLAEREGAKEIGESVRSAGLVWIWCPLA